MANITVIPATKALHTQMPINTRSRRRVAGYARVSTDSEEQLTSYEAQVDYYTRFIRSNPDWEFVDVYTDEGISALNTKHRDGFNRMIEDALAGKINLIVTKSVSRFARNTVDSLSTIRLLKVGKGNLSPDAIPDILTSLDPQNAGPSTPAKGLCLNEVRY